MTNTARQSSLFHWTGFLQLSYPFISKTIWLSSKLLINQGRHTLVYWHSRFRMRPTQISFNIFFPFRSGILPYKFSCILSLAEQVHMNLYVEHLTSAEIVGVPKAECNTFWPSTALWQKQSFKGPRRATPIGEKLWTNEKWSFKKKKKRHLKWHTSLPGRQHSHW